MLKVTQLKPTLDLMGPGEKVGEGGKEGKRGLPPRARAGPPTSWWEGLEGTRSLVKAFVSLTHHCPRTTPQRNAWHVESAPQTLLPGSSSPGSRQQPTRLPSLRLQLTQHVPTSRTGHCSLFGLKDSSPNFCIFNFCCDN